ncbi:phosphatase PAP2 family protein [Antrihabitans cavernicola]|uniref:Phosphatase PAP2 family protein n=1 Tax=Antrihabitans cavernicola TaxID=2495913 RepID=A0A5A7S7L5_9NOCA|nr:phosphatase PAP2 family protein [Spelaeibacter cavernicola]KAA0018538.1 phosphatase PAP2 family protein [Spelaeibacter cavernicola]
MSDILAAADTLLAEIRTERGTEEVALWTLAVSATAFVAAWVVALRSTLPVEARIGWNAVRVASLLAAFTLFAVQAHGAGWLSGADAPTLNWFVDHSNSTLTVFAKIVTTALSPVGTVVLSAVAALYLWRRRGLRPAVLLLSTIVLATAASTLIKLVVARDRPLAAVQLVSETDFSYPSGHVTGTVALLGTFAILATAKKSCARIFLVVTAAVITCAVALCRLYLGVHWLADVIGGSLLGCAMVVAAATVSFVLETRAMQASLWNSDLRQLAGER